MKINETRESLSLNSLNNNNINENEREAKERRRRFMWRACYGEFMATLIYFTPIFGAACHCFDMSWDSSIKAIVLALISGLQATAVIFTFSTISGAQTNCGITLALWLTGKLSNRKTPLYLIVQVLASICSMLIVKSTFTNPTKELLQAACILPEENSNTSKIFATEFFMTFILAYVAFTTAYDEAESQKRVFMNLKEMASSQGLTLFSSSPLSKVGFAPFAIGFTVFSLSMYGGTFGISMNPARMIGPAIIGNCWRNFPVYLIADILGACCGGLAVYIFHIVTEEDGPGLRYHSERNITAWILLKISLLLGCFVKEYNPQSSQLLQTNNNNNNNINNNNSINQRNSSRFENQTIKDFDMKNPLV